MTSRLFVQFFPIFYEHLDYFPEFEEVDRQFDDSDIEFEIL